MIEEGEEHLGLTLIKNGLKHDQSKLSGIELEYLGNFEKNKPPEFALALKQHVTTNPHHPEYWEKIQNMPKVYLAEMVCDWVARSSELGTNIYDYINNQAYSRFGFSKTTDDPVYKLINHYLDRLIEKWN